MTDKKYWFFESTNPHDNNRNVLRFDSLNEARAALYRRICEGLNEGGVIHGPHSTGVMCRDDDGLIFYSGRRAYQLPVKEDGSLVSGNPIIRGY